MEQAITHSERALLQAKKAQTDHPTTNMHALVEYLQKLKS